MSTRREAGVDGVALAGGLCMLGHRSKRSLREIRLGLTARTRPAISSWALVVFLSTQVPSGAQGAPGALDLAFAGFGDGGRLNLAEGPTGMALGPDGRIVLVGSGDDDEEFWVMQLLPNGAPDNTFSDDGFATFVNPRGPGYRAELQCVAVQSDHKIVVVGWVEDASTLYFTTDFMAGRIL